MLILRLITLFFFFTTISKAQWMQLNADTVHDYASIHFLNADTGFVVGSGFNPATLSYDGVIVRTLNGGLSWDTTHIWPNLMDIYFINDSIGYTGGQDGTVIKTVDMGANWNIVDNIGNNSDYSNLYFSNQDSGLFQTYNGEILMYTPLFFPSSSLIIDSPANTWFWGSGELDFIQNIGYFAGGNGIFAKSYDQGLSWNYFNSDPEIYVFDAKMTSPNHIVVVGGTDDQWVVGDTGKSTVSFDGGLNWNSTNQFATHDIVGVDYYNDLKGYCVGGINSLFDWTGSKPMGAIWQTTDGGVSWTLVDSSYNDQLKDIFVVNDSLAYIAGNNGYILKSITHYSTLGMNPQNDHYHVNIYPNPISDKLYFSSNSNLFSQFRIVIYDVTGKVKTEVLITREIKNITIDTQEWNCGLYIVSVVSDKYIMTRKIIKTK